MPYCMLEKEWIDPEECGECEMCEDEEENEWAEHRRLAKERKENNRKSSLKILQERGIKWELLNLETRHYRVEGFDYWPTTGKFYNQKTKQKGRGVFNLIKILKG